MEVLREVDLPTLSSWEGVPSIQLAVWGQAFKLAMLGKLSLFKEEVALKWKSI